MTSPARSTLDFLKTETGSAGLLLAATLLALVWANSPAADVYDDLWHTTLSLNVGTVGVSEDLAHWVNDALMALFFYVVGLEIRRELSIGELRDPRAAAVPALAALGGMVVPALVFTAINAGGPGAAGWGIVMATDIAFVLGALALLGDRIPAGVRVFLLTLAIVDDIGAIIVIAAFYTDAIDLTALAAAAGIVVAIVAARRLGPVWNGWAYAVAGVLLWYATYQSGIHPTIAGVVLGVLTSVDAGERFQHRLHPWSSYLVIPIFALANAGVSLSGDALSAALTSAITLGVIAGLVVGKLVGVAGSTLLAEGRIGPLPTGVERGHAVGVGALAGIGFTVSLFVADLAFDDPALIEEAKVGVLVASALAAAIGFTLLRRRGHGTAAD